MWRFEGCGVCSIVVDSRKKGGPNIDPQNTIVLFMGTLEKVPLILGNLVVAGPV